MTVNRQRFGFVDQAPPRGKFQQQARIVQRRECRADLLPIRAQPVKAFQASDHPVIDGLDELAGQDRVLFQQRPQDLALAGGRRIRCGGSAVLRSEPLRQCQRTIPASMLPPVRGSS